ncbi:hypothetical protein ABZP36_032333 [Zizania latifolia]
MARSFDLGFGMEDGVFCGVFDGHGRCGQLISRLVRDYLPFMILSHRNVLFLAADDGGDDLAFSDASPPSSTDSSGNSSPQPSASAQMLEEWREACTNAFAAMDGELKLQANIDGSFSGTTAVCAIKQVVSIVCATPRKQHASKAVAEAAVQRWKSKFPTSRVDDCSAVCLFLHDQSWGSAAAAAVAAARNALKASPAHAQS